ncbi:MAG: HlyD family efflux transporter periplasmic adaptor subunit [Saprospiraceae bacterium]|nr:HlyD family efflux transporter periplasmic adaptor subunit [Saprospiraceae bacterium]
MKFNPFYIILAIAFLGALYIINNLKGNSDFRFFGTAESDSRVINFDKDLLVDKLFVSPGQYVEEGDTLMIASRKLVDRDSLSLNETNLLERLELGNRIAELNKDKQLLESQSNYEIGKLQSELNALLIKDSMDAKYSLLISKEVSNASTVNQSKIKDLQVQIGKLHSIYLNKSGLMDEELRSLRKYSTGKINARIKNYQYNKEVYRNIVITAPFDGYVDQIAVQENASIQAFKDLFRINPKVPTRIIGFIHESSQINFQLGDSVQLSSATRQDLISSGIITSVSPRLVELPLRLRKFIEVRAWGREVFIQMNSNQGFYIGEKISISLNQNK